LSGGRCTAGNRGDGSLRKKRTARKQGGHSDNVIDAASPRAASARNPRFLATERRDKIASSNFGNASFQNCGVSTKIPRHVMKLGILGPSSGDVNQLGRAAEFLLRQAKAWKVVYLDGDGTLDKAVAAWARKIVGDDASDDGSWERAAALAAGGSAAAVDAYVHGERARLRLRALESLPEETLRAVEQVGERVVLLTNDRRQLEDDTARAANILIYGDGSSPTVRKIGTRWFLSPGPLGCPGGGIAVLDDDGPDLTVSFYDASFNLSLREELLPLRAREPG
jgi:hypothetical protein